MTEFGHGESSGVTLTAKERENIQRGIEDLDSLLFTCSDSGLWRELTRVRRHLADELAAGRRLPIGEDTSAWYDYEIVPLSAESGFVGWRLRLLRNGVAVGGSVFPVIVEDGAFLPWWRSHTEDERTQWLMRTATGSGAEAYLIHLLDEAWRDATQTAGEWLDSRPERGAEDDPS
jgi:hypothetical protein